MPQRYNSPDAYRQNLSNQIARNRQQQYENLARWAMSNDAMMMEDRGADAAMQLTHVAADGRINHMAQFFPFQPDHYIPGLPRSVAAQMQPPGVNFPYGTRARMAAQRFNYNQPYRMQANVAAYAPRNGWYPMQQQAFNLPPRNVSRVNVTAFSPFNYGQGMPQYIMPPQYRQSPVYRLPGRPVARRVVSSGPRFAPAVPSVAPVAPGYELGARVPGYTYYPNYQDVAPAAGMGSMPGSVTERIRVSPYRGVDAELVTHNATLNGRAAVVKTVRFNTRWNRDGVAGGQNDSADRATALRISANDGVTREPGTGLLYYPANNSYEGPFYDRQGAYRFLRNNGVILEPVHQDDGYVDEVRVAFTRPGTYFVNGERITVTQEEISSAAPVQLSRAPQGIDQLRSQARENSAATRAARQAATPERPSIVMDTRRNPTPLPTAPGARSNTGNQSPSVTAVNPASPNSAATSPGNPNVAPSTGPSVFNRNNTMFLDDFDVDVTVRGQNQGVDNGRQERNAQMETLRSQVTSLEGQVQQWERDIAELQRQDAELDGPLNQLSNDLTKVQNEANETQTKIKASEEAVAAFRQNALKNLNVELQAVIKQAIVEGLSDEETKKRVDEVTKKRVEQIDKEAETMAKNSVALREASQNALNRVTNLETQIKQYRARREQLSTQRQNLRQQMDNAGTTMQSIQETINRLMNQYSGN